MQGTVKEGQDKEIGKARQREIDKDIFAPVLWLPWLRCDVTCPALTPIPPFHAHMGTYTPSQYDPRVLKTHWGGFGAWGHRENRGK